MIAIDLNADLGEGCPWDEALLERVTSASVSCGAHAGDADGIRATLRAAKRLGVVVGAHPGFPDREGFGRRERDVTESEVFELVDMQLRVLAEIADSEGVSIGFVKPHGALYNQAQRDLRIARGIVAASSVVLGLPGSAMASAAAERHVPFVAEGFADRGYRPDGTLVPRGEPGAILLDESAISEQVVELARSGRIQTLCLHGDDPRAVALADLVLATFKREGIAVRSFAE